MAPLQRKAHIQPTWRKNHNLSDVAGHEDMLYSSGYFSGRLAPRRTSSSRSVSPIGGHGSPILSGDTRSPLQRQLHKHERSQKVKVQHLASQLEAIYEHLEALDHDEKRREHAVAERFEAEGEALRVALGEIANLADRVTAVEDTQHEAATAAAAQAQALAALAAEVQGMRAHADATANVVERLQSAQREAQIAHGEVGVLRSEVHALHEARRDADTRTVALEGALLETRASLEQLTRQHATFGVQFAAQHEAARVEHSRLAMELRDAASAPLLKGARTWDHARSPTLDVPLIVTPTADAPEPHAPLHSLDGGARRRGDERDASGERHRAARAHRYTQRAERACRCHR